MTKSPSESTRYGLSMVRFLLGFLFIQHGLEKLWGFAGGRVDRDFSHLHGLAGPIEFTGGVLLILGLFIRPTAFILCGEMAVAYFVTWAPHGFWPISNGVGGELSVIDCFAFLWLVTAGAGPLSLDALINRRKGLGAHNTGLAATLASWQGYARSILRVVLAFLFSLHGFRMVFGMFPPPIRFKRAPMALDALPSVLRVDLHRRRAAALVGIFHTSHRARLVAPGRSRLFCFRRATRARAYADRWGRSGALLHSLLVLHPCWSRPMEPGSFVSKAATRCNPVR